MAYAQGAVVVINNPYSNGRQPVLIVSNDERPYQGKQYTIVIITTTEREEAVRLDADDLTEGELDVSPSFVNPWSVHEVEHTEIDRRVAQVSPDVIRAVADSITRYVELQL